MLCHGGLHQGQQAVGQVVQYMDGPAVYVHGEFDAEGFKCMYHLSFLSGMEKGWGPPPFPIVSESYWLFSHFWLATVQEVLQAD